MWKIIISFLVLVISLPYSAFGITVSGTVLAGDDNNAALYMANVCVIDQQTEKCSTKGAATDEYGKFTINNVDKTSNIQISFVGYETQTLPAKENMGTIILKTDNSLEEVFVDANKVPNCSDLLTLTKLKATSAKLNSETNICEPTGCICGYTLNNSACIIDKTINQSCKATGATKATYKCVANGSRQEKQCVITECNTALYKKQPQEGNCTSKDNDQCDTKDLPEHAKSGKYNCVENSCICKVKENDCQNNYVPNADGTGCVSTKCQNCQIWDDSKKQCTDDIEIDNVCTDKISNSKTATYTCESNVKSCTLTDCNPGYQKHNNQCKSLSGTTCSNPPPHATDTYRTFDNSGNEFCHVVKCKGGYNPSDEGTSCVPAKEYDMDALEQNADQAHENENSLANRMLGGASMAAMGIGGMELARGIAEQNADADAERDMTAYLATFKCEYGPNHADGNTTGNEVPGANQLFDLYQEYAALASSVKATKEALNMTPGIESQVILDKANIGLYDDVSTGKTNGTYASLYRAKMGSDVDQAKLQEMSDASKNRIVAGAVTASTGAIAGIGGDVLLNQIDWNKNNSDAEDAE